MTEYDKKHWENIKAYLRRTQRAFHVNADQLANLYAGLGVSHPFDLNQHPQIKKAIEKRLRELAKNMEKSIVNGIHNEWVLSNNKNDEMVAGLLKGRTLPPDLQEKYFARNSSAMTAFIKRTEAGMGLSDRIWETVRGHSVNIEREMALGIYERTPSKELASQIKKHLNEPDRLYRRVRDASGELRLSRAARQFEPGRGKYRSAYKNALRLTRTETNKAYQKADAERWKQQDFVLGVRVHRSSGAPYPCDICEAGVGDYPKDYEWDLFHPNCLCYSTTIEASEEEFDKHLDALMEGKEHHFDGYVQDIPDSFKELQQKTNYQHMGH